MDSLISEFYNDYKNAEFEYGKTDCMLFVNDWLVRNGKTNYRNVYRHNYNSKEQAVEVLRKYDCETTADLISMLFDEVSPRRANRGSLCSTDTDDGPGPAMGVYDGENGLFLLKTGLRVIPKAKLSRFWSIG